MKKYGLYFNNNSGLLDIPENGNIRGKNTPPLIIETDSEDFCNEMVGKYGKLVCEVLTGEALIKKYNEINGISKPEKKDNANITDDNPPTTNSIANDKPSDTKNDADKPTGTKKNKPNK